MFSYFCLDWSPQSIPTRRLVHTPAKMEASDQVWRRSETRQLLRLSTNYERAHFKWTYEWRKSATTIYYFMLMLKQTRRRIGRRQTWPENLLCIFFMVSRWQTGSFFLLPQPSYFFTSHVGTRAILPTWNKLIPASAALPPFFCWRLFRVILVVCPHSLFFSPPSSRASQLTRETGQQNGLAGLAKRSEKSENPLKGLKTLLKNFSGSDQETICHSEGKAERRIGIYLLCGSKENPEIMHRL